MPLDTLSDAWFKGGQKPPNNYIINTSPSKKIRRIFSGFRGSTIHKSDLILGGEGKDEGPLPITIARAIEDRSNYFMTDVRRVEVVYTGRIISRVKDRRNLGRRLSHGRKKEQAEEEDEDRRIIRLIPC